MFAFKNIKTGQLICSNLHEVLPRYCYAFHCIAQYIKHGSKGQTLVPYKNLYSSVKGLPVTFTTYLHV